MASSIEFEGGAARRIRVESDDAIHFSIAPDPGGGEALWFYFRVTLPQSVRPRFVLDNAAEAHQREWSVTRPVFSADGSTWVRAEEIREDAPLLSRLLGRKRAFRFRSPIASKGLWVAYAYPYTDRELQLFLDKLCSDPRARVSSLGRSGGGRAIPRISIDGGGAEAPVTRPEIWVVCREHPGESPASFVLEGMLDALLRQPAGLQLLQRYRFEIVPVLNVDGVAGGLYYRNPQGVDLAQDWGEFRSAEVRALHSAMRDSLTAGLVGLVIDLHSANTQPKGHFFLETPEPRLKAAPRVLQRRLLQTAEGVHPQLQARSTVPLWENPGIAGNYLNERYGVYTLYSESNYSLGADGTVVRPQSLREVGSAILTVVAEVLVSADE